MANAKPRDVQAGWGIYRGSGFTGRLDQINRRLLDRGFSPISDRTYSHYRKLARYGYERYVPINQLDVETLRDPVWDAPLRSRFRTARATVDVQLILLLDGDLVILSGTTQEVSESQATILVPPSGQLDLLARATDLEGTHTLVVLADVQDAASAVIELVAPADDDHGVVVSISFLQLVPAEDITGRQPLPTTALRLRVDTEDARFFLNVVRELYSVLEAIESTRLACDEALAQLDRSKRFTIRPPEVVALSKSNPIDLSLTGAAAVVIVFSGIVGRFLKHRLSWYSGSVVQQQANLVGQQASAEGQKATILAEYARALRIRNDRAELREKLDTSVISTYVVDVVRKSLPEEAEIASDDEVDDTRLRSLIEHQLIPSMDQLVDESLKDLDVSADVEVAPLPDEFDNENGAEDSAPSYFPLK
jgi:hypothetical protein